MLTWLYLLCCLLVTLYVLVRTRTRRARALLAHLPSYPQWPLVGNMLELRNGAEDIFRILNQTSVIAEEKGKPFVLWMGPSPLLLCHEPDDVRTIVNNLIEKPHFYNFAKIYVGNGLVTAPASIWKHSVKKLSCVFTTTVVEGYLPVFNAQASALLVGMRRRAGGPPFYAQHDLSYTTLEAICQTAFGVSRISDSVKMEQYYRAFNRCFELFINRGLNLLTHPDCVYRLTTSHRELARQVRVLHHVSETVLQKRKLEREKTKYDTQTPTKDAKFRSVLDILLDIGESDPHFTEQQIKSEVDTIIVGGQETVATTVTFILLMLGSKPEVQDELYQEMRSIFGSSCRPVEKADLARMVYCEAVINETLRLFPPVPGVMRYADKEVQLKSCTIPIGAACVINAWGAGRSKRAWGPDALEYRPERWLKGEVAAFPAAAFLPFSYGRRSCIGKKYAMIIMKTIIAHCVRELEFSSEADKLNFKVDVALRPTAGNLLQVKLRT